MKIILSVIAVCLVMITVKLYTPEANADPRRSTKSVENIIEDCSVTGHINNNGYMYGGEIDC